MPTADHAVIAAAGFGSRLGRGHPKCLVQLGGRTLLEQQLALLTEVSDVRVVVGFEEEQVIAAAVAARPDVTIVRNPAYARTTTLDSYAAGARHLVDPCLFMDADIWFDPGSFASFLDVAARSSGLLVGYTWARTEDAVHVAVEGERITGFSRTDLTPHEWANIAYLPAGYCETGAGAVFERMTLDLPLPACFVDSWEIDRPADLLRAERHLAGRFS